MVDQRGTLKHFSKEKCRATFGDGYDQAQIKDQWLFGKANEHLSDLFIFINKYLLFEPYAETMDKEIIRMAVARWKG